MTPNDRVVLDHLAMKYLVLFLISVSSLAKVPFKKSPESAQKVIGDFYWEKLQEVDDEQLTLSDLKRPFPGYILNGLCRGKKVLITPILRLESNSGKESELVSLVSGYTGSAGSYVGILLWDEISNGIEEAYWGPLIDVVDEKKASKGSCPKIQVLLHGVYFERAGNSYGKAYLEYKKGKYRLLKSQKGKVVEIK